MEVIMDDFFKLHPFRKIDFNFGNETSQIEMNSTNLNSLRAILNETLSLEYEVIGGDEQLGLFDVEGRNSEASLEELQANLSGYAEVLDYESKVSDDTIEEVQDMIQSRGNFLGVSDLRLKKVGGEYIMAEFPERLSGNSSILDPLDFEARLWTSENETIRVFTSADVARVDQYFFETNAGGWAVPLTLKSDAAEYLRQMAEDHGAISEDAEVRDQHRLGMFFNGVEVYNASFSDGLAASMRSEAVPSILAMTGGGRDNDFAQKRAEELYINLEASFPTKLRTAGEGQIPPVLGRDFSRQVAAAAGAALLGVSVVVFLRYRRLKLVFAILAVSLSEVLIILGFSVVIGWYLDLASVAGIIAVIGTGVDHQIIITDEAVYQGEGRKRLVIETRISRAFFIIFTAAATTVIAMSPLAYVGLGRLRGFAIVTIVGVVSGVLITRPAFGRIVRRIVGGR
jgi:preprotein translocase subunit SecD